MVAAPTRALYRVSIGSRRGVVVSDGALIEQLLRARPDTFRRVEQFQTLAHEVGTNGVFTAEGDSWRRQRRLATESLSQRHFERFFPALAQSTIRLRGRWLKAKGEPVDVLGDLTRLTVDVTTGLAFGLDTRSGSRSCDHALSSSLSSPSSDAGSSNYSALMFSIV